MKLKICLLLYEKLTLQSMQILSAYVKRFVRRSQDAKNKHTSRRLNVIML